MKEDRQSLRVLQIASSLYEWGGIERYVAYLQQGLEARGHLVDIACPPGSPLTARSAHPGISIEIRRKFDLSGFAAYLRLFRDRHYDVVHAHFSPDFTLPAYAAKLRRQGLTVMTRHVCKRWSAPKARTYARLWRHIIPVSHAVERRLLESGIPPSQMTVAKAGLPAPEPKRTREEVRADLGLASTSFAVGSFGRLVPDKGIHLLIEAARALPTAKFFIFGHGPGESELKRLAADLPSVAFKGNVPDPADYMSAMDVVAIPSTWEEPFPYAALEAMALARPVVASDIGGLPEMVEDRTNGRLFSPGDSTSLADALKEIDGHPEAAGGYGIAGRERYLREFTIEAMAERIERVYLENL